MLNQDVPRIMAEKGIANPKKLMLSLGFQSAAIKNILSRKRVRLDYDQVGKLCLALHCTPNDLLSWQPDAEATIESGHPMSALKRTAKTSIPDMLKTMTSEQIEEMRAIMETRLAAQ